MYRVADLMSSLLDQSMIPLMGSYLVIYALNAVMLAGNHALPMTLRFLIWTGSKIWRKGEINETLHFLLDHPRRRVPLHCRLNSLIRLTPCTDAFSTCSRATRRGSWSSCWSCSCACCTARGSCFKVDDVGLSRLPGSSCFKLVCRSWTTTVGRFSQTLHSRA